MTVTDGVDPSGSNTIASLSGRFEGRYQRLKTSTRWVRDSCGPISNRRMNGTSRETLTGSGGGAAAFSVSLSEDGTYQIAALVVEGRHRAYRAIQR